MTIIRRQSLGYATLLVLIVVLAAMSIGWLVWQDRWQDQYSDAVEQVEAVTQIDVKAQDMVASATGWDQAKVISAILDDTWGIAEIGPLKEAVAELTPFVDSLAALKTASAEMKLRREKAASILPLEGVVEKLHAILFPQ